MAQDQVEEIKRKVDIVEVIGEHVALKKSGSNYKGLCPFHSEKSPSFMVSQELQIFKCFGCGVGGDVYKFLMDYEKIEFPQALKILADRAGVKLIPLKGFTSYEEKEEIYKANFIAGEFYHYLLTSHKLGEIGMQYLKKRGVTGESIKTFKLGFAPDSPDTLYKFLTKKRGYSAQALEKAGLIVGRGGNYYDRFRGRIIFPLSDHYGNSLGFSGRVIKDGGDIAKYINSPDTLVYKKGQNLYGLSQTKQAIKEKGFVVVAEGEVDLISSFQAGVKNIVAIKGSAFTQEQAELIGRFTKDVRLALDSDFAGDAAARRGIETLRKTGIDIKVVKTEFKDPDEAARANPEAWAESVANAQSIYDFLIDSVFEKYDPKTTEGKEKISRELSPILGSIEDEIVKSACSKIVAVRLGVPETAVLSQASKYTKNETGGYIEPKPANSYDRRQMLEDRLLALKFQTDPNFLKVNGLKMFKTPKAAKILEELEKYKEEKFDAKTFAQNLPAEISNAFTEIFLSGQFDGEDPTKESETLLHELEELDAREKIRQITRSIAQKDKEGDQKGIELLNEELNIATKALGEASNEL